MNASANSETQRQSRLRKVWWIVAIGLLVAVALVIAGRKVGQQVPGVPYSTFLDQLDAGNVKAVTFDGTAITAQLKQTFTVESSNGVSRDDVNTQVPAIGDPALIPLLRQKHVIIDVAVSSAWLSLFGHIPWMIWLFAAALLVGGIRRLMPGKKQSEAAMPMHPMQGIMGLAAGLFGKPAQGAGPGLKLDFRYGTK